MFPSHDQTTGRGLWGGYGQIPESDQGVFLQVIESYPEEIFGATRNTTGSLIEICGFSTQKQRMGELAQQKQISEAVIAIPFVEYDPSNAQLVEYIQ